MKIVSIVFISIVTLAAVTFCDGYPQQNPRRQVVKTDTIRIDESNKGYV